MVAIGTVSEEGYLALPPEIRAALAVEPGDLVEWKVTGEGRIELSRAAALDGAHLHALQGTLQEWETVEDEEAYRGL